LSNRDSDAYDDQEAEDALAELRTLLQDDERPRVTANLALLADYLDDVRHRDDAQANEPTTAQAIVQLASAVSDIGPAITELAARTDHTSELGDLARGIDDLSQTMTKGFNEGRV